MINTNDEESEINVICNAKEACLVTGCPHSYPHKSFTTIILGKFKRDCITYSACMNAGTSCKCIKYVQKEKIT